MNDKKILVLEDEEGIRTFIVFNLKREGYTVLEADTGEKAIEIFEENPDITMAILDVMLPGIDGFEVCRHLRLSGFEGGIVMLTARSMENDKIDGFMNGADDYVTKPFSVVELGLRVKALDRRLSIGKPHNDDIIRSGIFEINLARREVLKGTVRIDLTQVEFDILKELIKNREKALTRNEILQLVWGKEHIDDMKIIDVNIRRLRIKIEDDPADPKFIGAVRGVGYRWEG
ncbi:MAG: response regulator transcription factor [Clostridia bacterium]